MINIEILLNTQLPLPELGRQLKLTNMFTRVKDEAEQATAILASSVALLTELKRSLISAAVSGEFDVSTASGRGVPA